MLTSAPSRSNVNSRVAIPWTRHSLRDAGTCCRSKQSCDYKLLNWQVDDLHLRMMDRTAHVKNNMRSV